MADKNRQMDVDEIRQFLRRVDRTAYPELDSYSWAEVYGNGDAMAPGGLFLATKMTRCMNLKPGQTVLDLGCGNGDSSIFLAKRFGVRVFAVDLWINSSQLSRKFVEHGCGDVVVPLSLDITGELPFAEGYFDAVFTMQSFHYFGANEGFIAHLAKHLKSKGQLCIGNTCFNDDTPIPADYKTGHGWEKEYGKYHSPSWWESVFSESGVVNVQKCEEVNDGRVMWEDELIFTLEESGWNQEQIDKEKWFLDQLRYARNHMPFFTHYVALLEKKS